MGTYSNFWSAPAERSGDGAFVNDEKANPKRSKNPVATARGTDLTSPLVE
jgi:hypothetical protein